MTGIQKAIAALLAIGMVTTVILPGRQTPQVLGATERLFTGAESTSMGTSQGSVG